MTNWKAGLLALALSGVSLNAAHAALTIIDPDDFADGDVIEAPGVATIRTLAGDSVFAVDVFNAGYGYASTGTKVFGPCTGCSNGWSGMPQSIPNPFDYSPFSLSQTLRIDFVGGTNYVEIDVLPDDTYDPAVLAAYDINDNLIGTVGYDQNTQPAPGDFRRLSFSGAIAYIVVGGIDGDTSDLDRLAFGDRPVGVPEPATLALLGMGALGLAAVRRRKA
jgi:hypothetical protein